MHGLAENQALNLVSRMLGGVNQHDLLFRKRTGETLRCCLRVEDHSVVLFLADLRLHDGVLFQQHAGKSAHVDGGVRNHAER